MNFYYDEEDGKIKYTMDLTHLFAKETEELQLILSLVKCDIEEGDFNETCDDLCEIIENCYKNNSTDVEDLGDILSLIDKKIEELFTSKENILKFEKLCEIRKKIKKFANKKFREGHDWIYKKEITNNLREPKIKYDNEVPRDYMLVEECEFQYTQLLKYHWYPGLEKLKSLIVKYKVNEE